VATWVAMRLPKLRRASVDDQLGITGVVRLDRRTKDLTKRLRPGDIAVIDHMDLDRTSAEHLVASGVTAVVNASTSTSGRYPNLGPEILTDAGVVLVDGVGSDVFNNLKDGDTVRVHDGELIHRDRTVASGEVLDAARVDELMTDARTGLSAQLESFTANTVEYLRRDRDLLLDGLGVPDISTPIRGRHVVVVSRGYDYQADLAALRHYIAEYKPVLIGVDEGADALVEAGHTPTLIVADVATVSEATLRCGAEIVVRARDDSQQGDDERLDKLGVRGVRFVASGTSEDLALILAAEKEASLIVSVGSQATLMELLDRGRAVMASTFLTRLRVGPALVDAKAVAALHRNRIRGSYLLLLLVASIILLGTAVALTPAGAEWAGDLAQWWRELTGWLQGVLP